MTAKMLITNGWTRRFAFLGSAAGLLFLVLIMIHWLIFSDYAGRGLEEAGECFPYADGPCIAACTDEPTMEKVSKIQEELTNLQGSIEAFETRLEAVEKAVALNGAQ